MIEIKNLTHQYKSGQDDEITAVDHLNLSIQEGEYVAILGHNGCGKSTTAKHLNALLLPTSGDVIVDGLNTKDEERLWTIRQRVGMVFQNPDNQLIATTVEEDIAFGPENLGIEPAEIRVRIDEALEAVGMTEFKEKAPHLLSGGQKQRVAIAGIIAMRPKYLVLDEPTAMLDPTGRREVNQTILKLNKEEGLTVINITHFMEEAVLADRVIVMEHGKIVMEGTPRQVFSQVGVLKQLRLDIPPITELASLLKEDLSDISEDIMTLEEMVVKLCP